MKTVVLVLGVLIAISVPLLASGVSNAFQESNDALQSRPDLDHGAALFHMCAACHGTSGTGTPDGEIPRIAGQHFSVLVKQLVDYRNDRRWDQRMEDFADQHHLKNAQEIADVAAYTSEIETAPEAGVGVGSGEFLAQGAEIYAGSCVSCHGRNANGSGQQRVPRWRARTTHTSCGRFMMLSKVGARTSPPRIFVCSRDWITPTSEVLRITWPGFPAGSTACRRRIWRSTE
jgi:cytochrome c553